MKYIYIYTTETARDKDWYKIGQTINIPQKRITAQDNSSNPEPLIVLHSWLVDDYITDKSIHTLLEDSGFNRLRNGREWFELSSDPIDDINTIIKAMGSIITESNDEITITDNLNTINNILDYSSIPHYSDLWWYNDITPLKTVPKQLDLAL